MSKEATNTWRADKRINCKHCIRNERGERVCTAARHPHPMIDTCNVCRYQEPRGSRRGLGDLVSVFVSFVTLGTGKRVANRVAAARGKSECGCAARKAALNRATKGGD